MQVGTAQPQSLCEACFAQANAATCKLVHKVAAETTISSDTDAANLQVYASYASKWLSNGLWVAVILVLAPIAVPLLELAARHMSAPLRPIQIWQSLPKARLMLCSAFLYAELTLLVLTCPFTAQIWFWSLLEFSTVVNFVAYLLDPRAVHAGSSLKNAMCQLLRPFVAAPYMVITLLRDVPHAHFVAFAAASRGLAVETLVFVASDGSKVSAARAFDANHAQTAATRRLAWPRMATILFICAACVYNQALLFSWPLGVWNTQHVVAPGIDGLLASQSNTFYNVSSRFGFCHDNSDGSGSTAHVSVWIDPMPRIQGGLPLVTFKCNVRESNMTLPFDLASTQVNIQDKFAKSTTLALVHRQRSMFFSVSIPAVSCYLLEYIVLNATLSYTTVSPTAYVDYLQTTPSVSTLGVLPLLLALKYLVQHTTLSVLVLFCALRSWRLWLCFDGILTHGLYVAERENAVPIDLDFGENLKTWFLLRQSVQTACAHCITFTTVFLHGAMVQCSGTLLAILVCCGTGTAPLPTYILLLMGFIGSVSTLVLLWPLTLALNTPSHHGHTLDTQLVELHFRCLDERAIILDDIDARFALFESVADTIESYDALHLTLYGFAITIPRLATLAAALPSLVSFMAFNIAPRSWGNLNPFNVLQPSVYGDAINMAQNPYAGR